MFGNNTANQLVFEGTLHAILIAFRCPPWCIQLWPIDLLGQIVSLYPKDIAHLLT